MLCAVCAIQVNAQTPQTPADNGPVAEMAADIDTPWYLNLDYAGFNFEVPAGSVVEKGSGMIIKYPDGTFGVSLTNTEERGVNQKRAFEVCRLLATKMHLPNPHVEKANFGKSKGAKATGELEGQQVTVLVLPYNDQQVTTVVLASPDRKEWTDHFLRTLKR